MRAARLYGARDVRIVETPDPVPGVGEVLVRVQAVAICPSDWRMWLDGHAGGFVPEWPITQGHEFSGDVAGVGADVGGLSMGDRVAVEPSWHCGNCDQCRAGRTNICRKVRFPSFPPEDGALAEFICCPAHAVCRLPDAVSYTAGALAEPLGVSMHAVRLASAGATERVVIQGAGCIGTFAIRLLSLQGVRDIRLVEPSPGRREWAAGLGLAAIYPDCASALADGVEGDLVIECSGAATALDEALRLTAPAGRVVVVGIPRDERASADLSLARRRELTVIWARRSRNTLDEAVRLVASGAAGAGLVPVRAWPLDLAGDALAATGEPGAVLRQIVEPQAFVSNSYHP